MFQVAYVHAQIAVADLRALREREDGQGLIEYALIISMVALAVFATLRLTGTNIQSLFTKVSNEV